MITLGYTLLSERAATSNLRQTYLVPGPAAQVSGAVAQLSGSDPASPTAEHYYMHDHLGSVRSVYDGSKDRVAGFDYSPYGAALGHSGPSTLTHRYTGHTWEADAQLYYAAALLRPIPLLRHAVNLSHRCLG